MILAYIRRMSATVFDVCSPYVRRMFAVCSPYVKMLADHSPYIRRMSAVYSPYVRHT